MRSLFRPARKKFLKKNFQKPIDIQHRICYTNYRKKRKETKSNEKAENVSSSRNRQ